MEEAIIYAFILCIVIFSIYDGIYMVMMKKDIETMHSMMRDIHHMLFVGSDESDIEKALEHHANNQDEIEAWDEA